MKKLSQTELNQLADKILDCAFAVHRELGPGLLESIYHECLITEFELNKIPFATSVRIPIVYKGFELEKQFEIDLIVQNEINIELKSVDIIHPLYKSQLLSYLRLTDKRLGYLINFNVELLKNGITRIVNKF